MHAGDDRYRQQFEQLQEIDAADRRLAAAALFDARIELRDALAADEAMAEIQKPIWASEDLKIGLASFRENGPGLAKFMGR